MGNLKRAPMCRMLCRLRDENDGAILLAAIVLLVFAILGTIAVVMFVFSTSKTSSNNEHHISALEIAETGLNKGILDLNTIGATLPAKINYPTGMTHPEAVAWLAAVGAGSYVTSGTSRYFLTTDNAIIGYGADGNDRRAVRCYYVPQGPGASAPAALYIDANTVNSTYNGNAFLIDGRDHSAAGTLLVGGAKPGVVTTSAAASTGVLAGLSNAQKNNIKGSTATPSIVTQSPPPIDINAFSSQLDAIADYTFNTATPFPGSIGQFGAADYPVTVVVNGDTVTNGNLTGYGILDVRGSLTAGGTITWTGIVIIHGDSTWSHGTPNFIGSVWIKSPTSNLRISGNPNILYSTEAVGKFGNPLKLDLTTWEEL
jgi:hypothetical protein